ncbi:LysR family transcriptional regulator [Pusillimonas sp. ANT_WB101]|nr:LysR family transcriptional regulator [Pusillimonas sp. ANT_WB101]
MFRRPPMDLNLLNLFATIVDAGTLSEAAVRHGITRSLVSRKLKELEATMGAQLLRRTTRHIELTQQGRIVYEHAVRIAGEVEAAQLAVSTLRAMPVGYVRISLPTGLSSLNLRPLMADLSRQYPDLRLRILFSNRVSDLLQSEIDIALRVVSNPPQDYVAREVCKVEWHLYASPEYLSTLPEIAQPNDLTKACYLCPPCEGPLADITFKVDAQRKHILLEPKIQTEDFSFLKQAAVLGAGVALLPNYMVQEEIREGSLQKVLPGHEVEGPGDRLWILTTRNPYPSSAVTMVIDFFRRELRKLIGDYSETRNPGLR